MRWVVNFTSYGAVPGGSGIRAFELTRRLAERHDVEVLVARDTHPSCIPSGVRVTRLPVRAAAPARRWLGLRPRVDADVFLTDHYPTLQGVPTLLTLHDRGGPRWRRAWIGRHLRRAAAGIAVSETVARAWGGDGVHVVSNGVSLPSARDEARGDHLLVCDPGLAHKGVQDARAAAQRVGRALREVGRGVEWIPHDELQRELASAAVVLCPAREEGFGLVPLEALAQGAAVVASDIPAHREVLGDAAFFAKPGDVEAWVAGIRQALRAGETDREAARTKAAERTWDRAAEELERIAKCVTDDASD